MDLTQTLTLLAAVKTICDQWGLTPYITAVFFASTVGAFIGIFIGIKKNN